jgi:hypothetical protein
MANTEQALLSDRERLVRPVESGIVELKIEVLETSTGSSNNEAHETYAVRQKSLSGHSEEFY